MRIPISLLMVAACAEPGPAPTSPPPPTEGPARKYLSDCSTTNPIARDTCADTSTPTRGLASCASLGVDVGQTCTATSASCYVERVCPDGHRAVSDYLICATEAPGTCFTRSSGQYKHDIRYLAPADRADLARRIQSLPLARYHYKDEVGGPERLGFITEDAPGAPFVTPDGTAVDLYALLAATIATVQDQERRIQALEGRLGPCGPEQGRQMFRP